MKGRQNEQAIVGEYEHVIESWKISISKVNVFFLYPLKK
jgi:hypothetical protein